MALINKVGYEINNREDILRRLTREFCNDATCYRISMHWVRYLFDLSDGNERVARNALLNDRELRLAIEQCHNSRNCSQRFASYQNRVLALNDLVEKRNFPLNLLNCLRPSQLVFDLHWFTIRGALQYVKRLCTAMMGSKNRLVDSDEDVLLITGKGTHNEGRGSIIQKCLMFEYYGRIGADSENESILHLHFSQKVTFKCKARCFETRCSSLLL